MKKFSPHENPDGGAQKISPQGLEKWGGNIWGGSCPPIHFGFFPPSHGGKIMNMEGKWEEMGGKS